MSNDVWKGGKGAWTTAGNWTSGVPTSTSSVTINSGEPVVTSAITIAALNNFGSLDFLHAGASKISGAVVNAGFFNIDNQTATGGTSLTVLGAFTNTGYLQVGYSDNSLTAADTIKVASLVNSIGEIDLNGGITSAKSVVLDVTGAAGAGFGVSHVVTGTISLSGFSTLEFQTGQFSQIASGATLDLQGPHAFVADASKLNANSALGGLNLVAGTLRISDGATITTNQAMNNINQIAVSTNGGPAATLVIGGQLETSGTVYVDVGGLGGSAVTVQGAVINDNIFDIGSSGLRRSTTVTAKRFVNYGDLVVASALPTAALSLLDIAGAAGFGQAGVLQGRVTLSGNAEIQFDSGQITSIAREGELDLFGKTARIADASSPGGNSALGGLRDVGGTLNLASGNVLATGALTIDQFGEVDVDTAFDFGGQGGSSLTVNGAVKNFGDFNLGGYGLTTGSQAVVNAFTNMGRLVVNGSFEAPERALLTVKSAAGFGVAGHVIGYVDVEGDASIQFASGVISTIDADATLQLYGPQATVSDLSGPKTNSALGGLASVAGTLQIDDGVKIANAANLVVGGDLLVDTIFGGSALTVKQTLTNNGQVIIGNSGLDRTSQISAAALHNNGSLFLIGGTTASEDALLKVASAAGFGAAGHLTGFVSLA
ncbi:MAG TPA: hypothetical protein VFE13_04860, partial [Caulobacteraceae bacterium]|nr:hypothetical protein [Caulobacteraceae bacterium]